MGYKLLNLLPMLFERVPYPQGAAFWEEVFVNSLHRARLGLDDSSDLFQLYDYSRSVGCTWGSVPPTEALHINRKFSLAPTLNLQFHKDVSLEQLQKSPGCRNLLRHYTARSED